MEGTPKTFGEKYVKLNDTPDVVLLNPRPENRQAVLDMYIAHHNNLLNALAECERMIDFLNGPEEIA